MKKERLERLEMAVVAGAAAMAAVTEAVVVTAAKATAAEAERAEVERVRTCLHRQHDACGIKGAESGYTLEQKCLRSFIFFFHLSFFCPHLIDEFDEPRLDARPGD